MSFYIKICAKQKQQHQQKNHYEEFEHWQLFEIIKKCFHLLDVIMMLSY